MTITLWISIACIAGGAVLGGVGMYRINRAFKRIDKSKEQP